jgi:hypothetical protein
MEDRDGFNPEWLAYLKRLETYSDDMAHLRVSKLDGQVVRIEVWSSPSHGIPETYYDLWLTNNRPSPYLED